MSEPFADASETTVAVALDGAFRSLRKYDLGSARGEIMPIDRAVRQSTGKAALRKRVEAGLVEVLRSNASAEAKKYACRQLRLVGTETSIGALAELLTQPTLTHAACEALEAIPGLSRAAPRSSLDGVDARSKQQIVLSLGRLRDGGSVDWVARELENPARPAREAALAALGAIGSIPALDRLIAYESRVTEESRNALGEALLCCARALRLDGHDQAARKAARLASTAAFAAQARASAERFLAGLDQDQE